MTSKKHRPSRTRKQAFAFFLVACLLLASSVFAQNSRLHFSSRIPYDVVIPQSQPTLDQMQSDFDEYSWLTFVALNWQDIHESKRTIKPAITAERPAWESWKDVSEVFRPGGVPPTPWGAPPQIPPICRSAQNAGSATEVLSQLGKAPLVPVQMFQQALQTGPLIDQNGAYVRYDIRINRPMFDYIVQHKLYSRAGQSAFTGSVEFPKGDSSKKALGAMMVKAAWKVLGPGDDPKKFHTLTAFVYTPASQNPPVAESCEVRQLGLVGLHIVHRTVHAPQWIWTTFEQVNNAPAYKEELSGSYNFFNSDSNIPINTAPPPPWDPNTKAPSVQLVRLTPIPNATQELNSLAHKLLSGSVWQNYELISTQWPTDITHLRTNPLGSPAPPFLANSVMESYIQGVIQGGKVQLVPNASSSCMGCHNNATMATGANAGFNYSLGLAQ